MIPGIGIGGVLTTDEKEPGRGDFLQEIARLVLITGDHMPQIRIQLRSMIPKTFEERFEHAGVLETLFKCFWDHRPQLDPYLRHVIARNQHETGDLLQKITAPRFFLVGSEDTADADTGNHYVTSKH